MFFFVLLMFLQRIAIFEREDSDSVRYSVNVRVISGSAFRDIYKRAIVMTADKANLRN